MDFNQYLVIAIFASTILALIVTDKRPSSIFAVSMLVLIVGQQLSLNQIINNMTNQGLVTLILLLLVSNAVDKTSLIKRLGRTLITANYTQSYWRLFGLSFL
jgi:di/tricarboxylate transporter